MDWTKPIEIDGQSHTAAEWAKMHHITVDLFRQRYNRGWRGRMLIQPKEARRKKVTKDICGMDCFNCKYDDCLNYEPPYSECRDIEAAIEQGAKECKKKGRRKKHE